MSAPIPGRRPEPAGYLVLVDAVTRIHFLDWGEPRDGAADGGGRPGVLLIHGLSATSWTWAPVASRLAGHGRVVAPDLRGHGLSDAPVDGYTFADLTGDALAAAEGAGLLDDAAARLVVAGHGFGAMVAASLARALGERCAGLVLVDGGWEELGGPAGPEPEELLRAMEEPPEVLRSMAAYLADRAGFDPATWDADQEHAARAAVVELPAGRVVPVSRPHVLAGCVDAMLGYRPAAELPAVVAPITVLVAADHESGGRRGALTAAQDAVRVLGRPPMTVIDLPAEGHNLMRYRPDLVARAIDEASLAAQAYHPGS